MKSWLTEMWMDPIVNLRILRPLDILIQFCLDFPKLADKVDMDEFSDEFETWPYRSINLRVTLP